MMQPSTSGERKKNKYGGYSPPIAHDEKERLEALLSYKLLDTNPEICFDDLVKIACVICNTPSGSISLIDSDRVYSKSFIGMGSDDFPREGAICSHAIVAPLPETVYQIENALTDERWNTHFTVLGDLNLRFYASAPLIIPKEPSKELPRVWRNLTDVEVDPNKDPNKSALGTICVFDNKIHAPLSETQKNAMVALSRLTVSQMELNKKNLELQQAIKERDKAKEELEKLNQHLLDENKKLEEQVKNLQKSQSILNTPAEKVIYILKDIKTRLSESDRGVIDYVVDVIGSHKLYKIDVPSALDQDQSLDLGVKSFLLSQFQTNTPSAFQKLFKTRSADRLKNEDLNNLERSSKKPNNNNETSFSPLSTPPLSTPSFHPVSSRSESPSTLLPQLDIDFPNENNSEIDAVTPPLKSIECSPLINSITQNFNPDLYRNDFKGFNDWNFDVFKFAQATNGNPLLYAVYYLFEHHNLFTKFPTMNKKKLVNFLSSLEKGYVSSNEYHNSTHATDVVLGCNYFLTHTKMFVENLSDVEILASLIAASAHDVSHLGVNNTFLINTENPLAIRYNDSSVLENFHCSESWRLIKKEENNFIENFPLALKQQIRKIMISMILATDMAHHPKILNEFQNKILTESLNITANLEDKLLCLRLMIKCSDISNPARPLGIYLKWVDRVMEEFFTQGDKEKKLSLPVSNFMDRTQPTKIPSCQIGFINYIVLPTYKSFTTFSGVQEPLEILEKNLAYWNSKVETS